MASLRERRKVAIDCVAKHFGAAVFQDTTVNVALIEPQIPQGSRLKPPRLRFDRVVVRLLDRLRTALHDRVPGGVTVVLTVTAPIRLASRTATAVEERIWGLLQKRSGRERLTDTINGNEIQIRLMRGSKTSTAKLAGFVHNRDSDPTILFGLAHTLLERTRKGLSGAGEHWLVLQMEDESSWTETYRHVCTQLIAPTDLQRVILVGSDGAVSTLIPRARTRSRPPSPDTASRSRRRQVRTPTRTVRR